MLRICSVASLLAIDWLSSKAKWGPRVWHATKTVAGLNFLPSSVGELFNSETGIKKYVALESDDYSSCGFGDCTFLSCSFIIIRAHCSVMNGMYVLLKFHDVLWWLWLNITSFLYPPYRCCFFLQENCGPCGLHDISRTDGRICSGIQVSSPRMHVIGSDAKWNTR